MNERPYVRCAIGCALWLSCVPDAQVADRDAPVLRDAQTDGPRWRADDASAEASVGVDTDRADLGVRIDAAVSDPCLAHYESRCDAGDKIASGALWQEPQQGTPQLVAMSRSEDRVTALEVRFLPVGSACTEKPPPPPSIDSSYEIEVRLVTLRDGERSLSWSEPWCPSGQTYLFTRLSVEGALEPTKDGFRALIPYMNPEDRSGVAELTYDLFGKLVGVHEVVLTFPGEPSHGMHQAAFARSTQGASLFGSIWGDTLHLWPVPSGATPASTEPIRLPLDPWVTSLSYGALRGVVLANGRWAVAGGGLLGRSSRPAFWASGSGRTVLQQERLEGLASDSAPAVVLTDNGGVITARYVTSTAPVQEGELRIWEQNPDGDSVRVHHLAPSSPALGARSLSLFARGQDLVAGWMHPATTEAAGDELMILPTLPKHATCLNLNVGPVRTGIRVSDDSQVFVRSEASGEVDAWLSRPDGISVYRLRKCSVDVTPAVVH